MMSRTAQELVTPQRLRAFFAPESIALVGASDNSGWARFIVASCAAAGFAGPLTAVHPRAGTAFGLPVVPSLRDLPTPADLAFILAPARAVEGVLDEMGAAGIPNAVVLASGYRETGEDGRALEDAMTARAIANGVTVLGPNCLGFVNAHTRAAPYALSLVPPLTAGPVGVALQSGALASVVLNFARAHAIGLSVLTSMGNECLMKTVDVLDYLVEDEATRVICLFLEGIGDPAKLARVAEKAGRAGKPIVALKVGSSPVRPSGPAARAGLVRPGPACTGPACTGPACTGPPAGPWSEAAARRLLAAAGVPVVPGELAGSAEEAAAIARKVGLPAALKVCSAQITHKSDIGVVVLGLGSPAEVRAGYEKVRAAGEAVPGASIDGVLVTPMRSGGTELLAGVTVDPTFGPVLAVGLGGIWTEILADTSLRVLPVDAAEVRRMLGELRGWPLLRGARGTQPADLDGSPRRSPGSAPPPCR